jgi:hypothetical protein
LVLEPVLAEGDVTVGLEVGLGLTLGLLLGLPEGLEPGLAVLSLDDVAGAAVVWVPLAGELVSAAVADEDAEDREQDVVGAGSTTGLLDTPPAGVATGVLPWPSGTPPPVPLFEEPLSVKA